MSYIGSTPTTQSFIAGTDYFNGTGSQTAFTLSRNVVSVNDIEAVINNVEQQPNTVYTVSGNTITFTSAPSAGTGNIYVRYLSTTTQSITPSQNTVSYSTLDSNMQSAISTGMKNRIINGAMVISQRNGTSTVATPTDGQYVLDRFATFTSGGGVYSVGQSTTAPAGFNNSMLFTVTTADSSIAATDYYLFTQSIEGYNIADLGFGTASAKTVTLSFWVRSSVTGTFGFGLRQGSGARSYVAEYTISAANTWEQKTITIAGDTAGTWDTTNGSGMICTWDLGSGSNRNATANTWGAGNYWRTSGDTNLIATNGATFYITGVQLEVGSSATGFEYRLVNQELNACQRYFSKSIPLGTPVGSAEGPNLVVWPAVTVTLLGGWAAHKVSMRAQPSIIVYRQDGTINSVNRFTDGASVTGTMTVPEPGSEGFRYLVNASNSFSAGTYYQFYYTASAEL